MSTVIQIEDLWKEYRLGVIGHGTLTHDLQSWWARVRGKEDPNSKIKPTLAGQEKQIDGDHFWALRGINFEVKQGEVLGIIGKNGAGKSTLLKILSRVTAPTRGNIKVKGRIASLLEVGTGFHPELTGRENIFMNGAILGMSKQEIRSKLDEIIDFSGVEQFVDTPVKRYSSGMYVRLAFAVAAHLEPEILVVDEVLAVGDAAFQNKCLGKMSEVAINGRTILFVSHNMSAVNRLCSRAILLENGRVSRTGLTLNVTAAYLGGGKDILTFRKWNDFENNQVNGLSLISFGIFNDKGKVESTISVTESFEIHLVYKTEKQKMKFRCAIVIYTQGVIAFCSVEPTEVVHIARGTYKSRVKIPDNIMAEGDYTIGFSIFTTSGRKEHFYKMHDVLKLQVVDSINGKSARGDYTGNLAGVVRPNLQWDISLITESSCEYF